MKSLNGNSTVVKGRGLNHRHLSANEKVALVVGLMAGTTSVTQLSWRQALTLVPGVAVSKARIAHRNGGNGK
jgi:hypothetical protein